MRAYRQCPSAKSGRRRAAPPQQEEVAKCDIFRPWLSHDGKMSQIATFGARRGAGWRSRVRLPAEIAWHDFRYRSRPMTDRFRSLFAITAPLVFSALSGCSASDEPAAASDGGAGQDAASGSDAEAIPCEQLVASWKAFVDAHNTCTVDADCTFIAGSMNYCSCAVAIGSAGGDAISTTAWTDAQPFLKRFAECRDAGYPFSCETDHGPNTNLRCNKGRCVYDFQYCGVDAGSG